MWKTWHESGAKATRTEHGDGGSATFQRWDPSGQLRREGQTLVGKPHGRWVGYSDAGKVTEEMQFELGLLQRFVVLPSVGVPACDEYLRKYLRCIDDKAPNETKGHMRAAAPQMIHGWQQLAQDRGRDFTGDACEKDAKARKQVAESLACDWPD